MTRISDYLDSKYQRRIKPAYAIVQSYPRDAAGKSLGYVTCTIANNDNVKVMIGPNDVFYPGDGLIVEPRGTPSAATYHVIGMQAQMRPDSGAIEFVDSTSIGEQTYDAGDLVWGNPFESHFWFDYSDSVIRMRSGTQTNGQISTDGTIDLGDPAGVHMHSYNTGIQWKNGETILSAIDAAGRTIYGFERLGRPHGPAIEWRETLDDESRERFAFQGLGMNGVPWFSFVSGTDENPDDYRFYVGPVDAANRMSYEAGDLAVTGAINAKSGSILGTLYMGTNGQINIEDNVYLDHNGLTLDVRATQDFGELSSIIKWRDESSSAYIGKMDVSSQLLYAGGFFPDKVSLTIMNDGAAVNAGAYMQLLSESAGTPSYNYAQVKLRSVCGNSGSSTQIDVRAPVSGSPYIDFGGDTNKLRISGSGSLTMEGTASIQHKGITWLSGANVVSYASTGHSARMHPNGYADGPYADTINMVLPVNLPYQINGRTVYILSACFYGWTESSTYHFDSMKLKASDLDATITELSSYTTAASGTISGVQFISSCVALTDFPNYLEFGVNGGGSHEQYRIYGIRMSWTT